MGIYITILEQGLIYGILALGVYITYKILDFPDLTVDGSFPLGAALTATMITNGVNPYLTLPASFLIGAAAGVCTGLIHVKFKVRDLLSGIIMMTALWTINLRLAGTANVPIFGEDSIFENSFINGIFSAIKLNTEKIYNIFAGKFVIIPLAAVYMCINYFTFKIQIRIITNY